MARVKKGSKSVRRYFIELFNSRPELLRELTNEAAIAQWVKDHPGKKCTSSIKSGISNVKSELRGKMGLGKLRRKRRKGRPAGNANGIVMQGSGRKLSASALEKLEILIDECLTQARQTQGDELAKVIQHLRLARNTVVFKQGKFDSVQ